MAPTKVEDRSFVGTEGIYLLPHQVSEVKRLQQQHRVIKSSTGGVLLTTPLTQKKIKILDCGAADGHWLLDIARIYPDHEWSLHGVDIASSLFPPKSTTDPALDLHELDIRNPPPAELAWEGTFDLLHQRFLVFGIPDNAWLPVLKNHFNLLRPGGYIQLVEAEWVDAQNPLDSTKYPAMVQLEEVFRWCDKTFGLDTDIGFHLEDRLKEAGFEEIQKNEFHYEAGAAATEEELKFMSAESVRNVFRSVGVKLQSSGEGIPGVAGNAEEYLEWADRTYDEMLEHGWRPKLSFVIGRRPL